MNAMTDFPTIEELSKVDTPIVPEDTAEIRDGKALVKLTRTEAGLRDLTLDLKGKTYDLKTVKGNDEARADRQRCVKLRTALEAKRKAMKAPALEFGKLIDGEAKRITDAILALESPIDSAIKADEQRRADERAERERIEAERIAGLRGQVDAIMRGWLDRCNEPDMTSARVATGIEHFTALQAPADLADVADYWSTQQSITMGRMQTIRADLERAEESARLAAERAEQKRIADELEARRAEIAAQAAAVKAEAERLEAERQSLAAAQLRALVGVDEQAQAGVAENPHQQQAGLSVLSPADAAADDGAGDEVAPNTDDSPAAPAFDLTPEPTDLLGDAATDAPHGTLHDLRALLVHIDAAFTGRFPSHPKPDQSWWATLRTLRDNVNV